MLLVSAITTYDFIHQYSNAPEEVNYLRNLHRHLLHIEVSVEVFTEDREIEFYILKDTVDKYLRTVTFDKNASCETVSSSIMSLITNLYGSNRKRIVKVQEDNNGYVLNIKEQGE